MSVIALSSSVSVGVSDEVTRAFVLRCTLLPLDCIDERYPWLHTRAHLSLLMHDGPLS
jgi:hypothetical protein